MPNTAGTNIYACHPIVCLDGSYSHVLLLSLADHAALQTRLEEIDSRPRISEVSEGQKEKSVVSLVKKRLLDNLKLLDEDGPACEALNTQVMHSQQQAELQQISRCTGCL